MVLGFALVWVIIWVRSPFALELVVMSVRRDDTTQGIVTSGLSGIRSVGLCNICNSVGPLLTACSADVCVCGACILRGNNRFVAMASMLRSTGRQGEKKAKLLD